MKYYIRIIIYGMMVASVVMALAWFVLPQHVELMGARLYYFNLFLDDLSRQGIVESFEYIYDHNSVWYFYLAMAGKYLGMHDAVFLCMCGQFLAMWFMITLYPVMIYKVFHSHKAALFSPWIVAVFSWYNCIYMVNFDYWAEGWIVFLCTPLIILLHRMEDERERWVLFFFLCLLASFANVPRAHAGAGCMLASVCVMLYRQIRDGSVKCFLFIKAFCVLLFAVGTYGLFVNTIPNLYLRSLDAQVQRAYFGPWHTLYIGLGWDSPESMKYRFFQKENAYHLRYLDECALEVYEQKTGQPLESGYTQFIEQYGYSRESKIANSQTVPDNYDMVLRDAYWTLVQNDPEFVIRSYAKKSLYTIIYVLLKTAPMMIVTAVFLMWYRRHYDLTRVCMYEQDVLILSVMIAAVNSVFGLVAVPGVVYLIGSFSAIYMLAVLSILKSISESEVEGSICR